jgi:hypothetical protein
MKLPVEFSRSVLCVTLLAGLVWTGFLITPQPVSAGEVGGTTHTTSSSQSSLVFGTGLLSGGGGFEFVGYLGLSVNNLFLHDGLISGFGLPLTAVDAYIASPLAFGFQGATVGNLLDPNQIFAQAMALGFLGGPPGSHVTSSSQTDAGFTVEAPQTTTTVIPLPGGGSETVIDTNTNSISHTELDINISGGSSNAPEPAAWSLLVLTLPVLWVYAKRRGIR